MIGLVAALVSLSDPELRGTAVGLAVAFAVLVGCILVFGWLAMRRR